MADNSDSKIRQVASGRHLAGAAMAVMVGTGLSRIFGYIREVVAAAYFGAGAEKSAFDVAFLVPSTFQILVAQAALTAALIPVFAGLLEKEQRRDAWLVARTIFTLAMMVLGVSVVFFIILAPQIMPIFAPGYRGDPEMMANIVSMSRLLFPTILILAVTGIVVSILNSFEHFTVPAVAPVFWNMVIIIAMVTGAERLGVESLAWGVLIGSLVQLGIQLPWLRGRGGRLGWDLALRNPHVRQVGILILPVSISLGMINLNGVVDVQFASYLGEGGVAAMNYAFRLYQLPEALFAIAVGTVLFPTLSKIAARGKSELFRSTISTGLRMIFFLLIPISGLVLVLSEPIVRLVYERGEFSAADTNLVAYTLFFFAIGSTFSGGSALLTRGFFSLERPWIPTVIAFINLGFNALLNWLFIKPFELGGIALSTTVVSTMTFIALMVMLRRELGRIDGSAIIKTFVMVTLLSAVAAAASWFCWYALDRWLGSGLMAQLISVGGAMITGVAVFLAAALAVGAQELKLIISLRDPGGGAP